MEISREDKETYEDFMNEFAKESDRAAVVLGAAKLDLQLYQLLQKVLLPNTSGRDELLDGNSGLSTFSSRINICYRIGVIDAEFARALHQIRKIRNSFAHEISGSELDSGSNKDRIRELTSVFSGNEQFEKYRNIWANSWNIPDGSKLDFRIILSIVGARLEGHFHRCKTIYATTPCPLMPIEWE